MLGRGLKAPAVNNECAGVAEQEGEGRTMLVPSAEQMDTPPAAVEQGVPTTVPGVRRGMARVVEKSAVAMTRREEGVCMV